LPTSNSIISIVHDARSGSEFSHCLFEIYSSDDDHFFAGSFIKPVSDWAFKGLLEIYEKWQADAARELYNYMQWEPELASTNGLIWER
jgi:hypothetical protein